MFGGVCDKEEDEEELDSDSDDEGNEDSGKWMSELEQRAYLQYNSSKQVFLAEISDKIIFYLML